MLLPFLKISPFSKTPAVSNIFRKCSKLLMIIICNKHHGKGSTLLISVLMY